MTTRIGADYIRTSRQIRSFHGISNATGSPTQVADLGRMVRGETELFTRKLRRLWMMGAREINRMTGASRNRSTFAK